VWLSTNLRLLNPVDPEHSAVLVSFTDVTERHAASQHLAYQATHDSLTGLPNRAHVVARVSELLEADHHGLAAVLFIDLDNLKLVNDSLGHDAGDNVLQIAAQRLRSAVRSHDIVARFGGDEFVALLAGPITRPDLDQLAEQLHASLANPVTIAGGTLALRASIGIVEVEHNETRDAAEILGDADLAMYHAKTTGGGRSQHFTRHLRDRTRRRISNK
jgi:diguanylate cyclase (GGDEF)-like protein